MDSRRIQAFGVLGIPADSDQNAVAHAYRKLARATHPDVSNDPDAADRFAHTTGSSRPIRPHPRCRRTETPMSEEAKQARQALQESLDLRDQDHTDA